jgi:hypothetical protein
MVFNDGNIKEELLKTMPLYEKTRGENSFQSFYSSLQKINVPMHKLVSVTTNVAPARTGDIFGLIGSCKRGHAFPGFFYLPPCHSSANSRYKSDRF